MVENEKNAVATTGGQAPATTANKPTNLAPWKDALIRAEGRFMAIADPVKTKQEMGFAAQIIGNNARLKECTAESIINAVINVARTGITLNPILKLAHLVPRGKECVLDFDYKGLVKVLKDNNCVKFMDAFIVYEDEEFEQDPSEIHKIKHVVKHMKTEAEQKKRVIHGVYSRVVLPSGELIFTQLTPMWQIDKRKAKAMTKMIWDAWYEEMVLKTKIKMDFKLLVSGEPSEQLSEVIKVTDEVTNPGMHADAGGKSISAIFEAEDVDHEEVGSTATTETASQAEPTEKPTTSEETTMKTTSISGKGKAPDQLFQEEKK